MRPSKEAYFLKMAQLVASRGTCARRQVGCVLVNSRGHVVATGYNGVPSGFTHCRQKNPCEGSLEHSGQGLDKCLATHAEQNALLQCSNTQDIETCYTTVSPCIHCVKLLLNTSCKNIVFLDEYPHTVSKELWLTVGRSWKKGVLGVEDF